MKENVVINKMETRETCPKTFVWEKPDYSNMYFEFQFKDGEKARYRMDKDCHDLQQFLDRMNHFHDLEKENKRLQEQLNEANGVIKEYSKLEDLMSSSVGPAYEEPPAKYYLKKWGVK